MRRVLELQHSAGGVPLAPGTLQTKQYLGNLSPSDVTAATSSPKHKRDSSLTGDQRQHIQLLKDVPEPGTEPISNDALDLRDVERYVAKSELVRALTSEQRMRLLSASKWHFCPVGHRLITQGEEGSSMFIVMQGELDVYIDGRMAATHKGEGKIVGEMSIIYTEPRSATVVCGSPCKVIEVTARALRDALRGQPRVWQHLFAVAEKREIQRAVISRMHQLGAAVAVAKINRIKRNRSGGAEEEEEARQAAPQFGFMGKEVLAEEKVAQPLSSAWTGRKADPATVTGKEMAEVPEETPEDEPDEALVPSAAPPEQVISPSSSLSFTSEDEGQDEELAEVRDTATDTKGRSQEQLPQVLDVGRAEDVDPVLVSHGISRTSSGVVIEAEEYETEGEAERMAKEATAVMELLGDEDAMMEMYGEEGDQVLCEILAENPPHFIEINPGDDLAAIHQAMDRVKTGTFLHTKYISGPWNAERDGVVPTPMHIMELRNLRRDTQRAKIEVEKHLSESAEEEIAMRLRFQQHPMTVLKRMETERERMWAMSGVQGQIQGFIHDSSEESEEDEDARAPWLDEAMLQGHIDGQRWQWTDEHADRRRARRHGMQEAKVARHLHKLYPVEWVRIHDWLAGTWESIAALQTTSIRPPPHDTPPSRTNRHRHTARRFEGRGRTAPVSKYARAGVRAEERRGSLDEWEDGWGTGQGLMVVPSPAGLAPVASVGATSSTAVRSAANQREIKLSKPLQEAASKKKSSTKTKLESELERGGVVPAEAEGAAAADADKPTIAQVLRLHSESEHEEEAAVEAGAAPQEEAEAAPGIVEAPPAEAEEPKQEDSAAKEENEKEKEDGKGQEEEEAEQEQEEGRIGEMEAVGQSLHPSPTAKSAASPGSQDAHPSPQDLRPCRSAGEESNASSRLLGIQWPEDADSRPHLRSTDASASGRRTPASRASRSGGSTRRAKTAESVLPSVRGHSPLRTASQGADRSRGSRRSARHLRWREQGLGGTEPNHESSIDGPGAVSGGEEEEANDGASDAADVRPPDDGSDLANGAEEAATSPSPAAAAAGRSQVASVIAHNHAVGLLATLDHLADHAPSQTSTHSAQSATPGIATLRATAGVTTFRGQSSQGQEWGLVGIGPLLSGHRNAASRPATRGNLKKPSMLRVPSAASNLPAVHVKFVEHAARVGPQRSVSSLGSAALDARAPFRDPARQLGKRAMPTPGERGPTPLNQAALHRYIALSRAITETGDPQGDRGGSIPPPGEWGRSQSPVPERAQTSLAIWPSRTAGRGHAQLGGQAGRSQSSLGAPGEAEGHEGAHPLSLRWMSLPTATVYTTTHR